MVADVSERLVERPRELGGAGDVLVERLQDPLAQGMRERLDQPLIKAASVFLTSMASVLIDP